MKCSSLILLPVFQILAISIMSMSPVKAGSSGAPPFKQSVSPFKGFDFQQTHVVDMN